MGKNGEAVLIRVMEGISAPHCSQVMWGVVFGLDMGLSSLVFALLSTLLPIGASFAQYGVAIGAIFPTVEVIGGEKKFAAAVGAYSPFARNFGVQAFVANVSVYAGHFAGYLGMENSGDVGLVVVYTEARVTLIGYFFAAVAAIV